MNTNGSLLLGGWEELEGCIGCAEFDELRIDGTTIEVANFDVFRNSHLLLTGVLITIESLVPLQLQLPAVYSKWFLV